MKMLAFLVWTLRLTRRRRRARRDAAAVAQSQLRMTHMMPVVDTHIEVTQEREFVSVCVRGWPRIKARRGASRSRPR